jgi:flagellar basal-body rod protein FlgB
MDKTVGLLERMIRFAGMRHRVLSSNISNSDTPEYRAKDISFNNELQDERLKMTGDHPGHLQPGGTAEYPIVTRTEGSSWKDGNNVELDMEVAKMTENDLLYEASVQLINKKFTMFKNAIRGLK